MSPVLQRPGVRWCSQSSLGFSGFPEEDVKGKLVKAVGALVASVGIIYYTFLHESEVGVTQSMVKVFKAGGIKGWDNNFSIDANATVHRPLLYADLTTLLRPVSASQYGVNVGANGTGKSTAVRHVVRKVKDPKGVIYFLAPELVQSFSASLEKVVGYREPVDLPSRARRWASGISKEHIAPPPSYEPRLSWSRLSPKLVQVATAYKSKYDAPAVLIIDATDIVAKQDPAFFRTLQEFAKSMADRGTMRVIFVLSEGHALPLLQSASAWSRALKPLEILDVSDTDAVEVLTGKGIKKEVAKSAVADVTGRRFSLLLLGSSVLMSKSVD